MESNTRRKTSNYLLDRITHSKKGSGVVDVLLVGSIIVFILLPIFAAIMEKYLLSVKYQFIKDSMDVTNLSAYYALETECLGRNAIAFEEEKVINIYTNMLAKNMHLDTFLNPLENSIADSQVGIESLVIYTDNFPTKCPNGTNIVRPSIHSLITVPIKPVFFNSILRNITGKEYMELKIHVDSDIPVNN